MFKYIEKYVIRRGRWMGTRIGVLLIGGRTFIGLLEIQKRSYNLSSMRLHFQGITRISLKGFNGDLTVDRPALARSHRFNANRDKETWKV